MIRKQFSLDLNYELIIDNFAGGGGASTGIELALGRHVDHAINHDAAALGMHRINHPQTVHHCEDIFEIDPRVITEGRPVGLAHFSPDCKHFSKAKGGKPLSKKIRGLVLVMLRWAKGARPRVMTMENVEEIETWGPLMEDGRPDPAHKGRTWRAFLDILDVGIDPMHPDLPEILYVLDGYVTLQDCVLGFSYKYETQHRRACLDGTPTIRKRLYMIARCDGKPIVWPKATHSEPAVAKASRLKPYRTIAECLDWNINCPSIFLTREQARIAKCRRPLASSTLRRIAVGIDRYVLKAKRPFLVSLTHQGGDRVESIDEPVRTLTGAHRGEKALVSPVLVNSANSKTTGRGPNTWPVTEPVRTVTSSAGFNEVQATLAPFLTEHANASNQRNFPADEPCRTQCAEVKGGHFATVCGTLVQTGYGEREGQQPRALDVEQPLGTVVAGGVKHAAVASSLVKMRGSNVGSPIDEPVHTISAGGTHHGMVALNMTKFCTGSVGSLMDEPLSTISAGSHKPETHGGAATVHGVVAASLAAYYGNDKDGQSIDEPARTVTTRERFAHVESSLVHELTAEQLAGARAVATFLREYGVVFEGEFATVAGFIIVDIGMRMLTPRELYRAQGFPEQYIIDRAWIIDPATGEIKERALTKEEQIRMCGNSVCPPTMAAIIAANVPEMAAWHAGEKPVKAPRAKARTLAIK